jgi:hypothetical protein
LLNPFRGIFCHSSSSHYHARYQHRKYTNRALTVLFLSEHPASTYGIRLFAGMPEIKDPIRSYPLYCTPLLFLKPHVLEGFVGAR